MKKILITVLVSLFLGGCGIGSWFGRGAEVTEKPTELTAFQASVTVNKSWSQDIGNAGKDKYLRLTPVLGDDAIYAVDAGGAVSAYDLAGRRLWRVELKHNVTGATGYGDNLVLFGTSKGVVVALEKAGGKTQWTATVSSEVLAPPVARDGVVVVKTADGKAYGLASEDGKRRWVFERTSPALTLRGTGAPALHNNLVLTGLANGKLAAIDLQSGRLLWEASVAEPRGRNEIERLIDIDARPLVSDGVLYAAAFQGAVAAIALDSGRVLWNREVSSFTDLGADAKNLYVTDAKSQVLALDRRSGATVWKQDKLGGRTCTGPTPVGDYVACADFDGYVHLLAKEDGRFAGRARVDGRGVSVTPITSGQTLFVFGQNGGLTAFNLGRP